MEIEYIRLHQGFHRIRVELPASGERAEFQRPELPRLNSHIGMQIYGILS